jgi:hypothetical protein
VVTHAVGRASQQLTASAARTPPVAGIVDDSCDQRGEAERDFTL